MPIIETGIMCGACTAFLMSRYLFKDIIKKRISEHRWFSRNFNTLNDILNTEGAKMVALMRLTFTPFGMTSYALGVTSIPLSDFMLGTSAYFFNFPMQVFIGCRLQGFTSGDQSLENSVLLIEILITVIVSVILGYYAKHVVEAKISKEKRDSV